MSSLETKSITELRSLAQNMGLTPDWGMDKPHLLQAIREHVVDKVESPQKQIMVNIPPDMDKALTQDLVEKALEGFKVLGLHVSFPEPGQWEMSCLKKRDSGSMSMGLWSIVNCAKELVNK